MFDTPELVDVLERTYAGRNVYCYPDAAGTARKTVSASESDINLLKQAGFIVRVNSRNPAIMDRVHALNSGFCNANNERKIFVNTVKCPKLTKAVEQQAYDDNTKMPDKKNGHDNKGIDALGYLVSFLFPVRSTRKPINRTSETTFVANSDWNIF